LTREHALALAGAVSVFGLSVWLLGWSRRLPVAPEIVVDRAFEARVDTLRANEVLGTLLARRGVPPAELTAVVRAVPGFNPRRLRSGLVFEFEYPLGESTPVLISSRLDPQRVARWRRRPDAQWWSDIEPVAWEIRQFRVTGAVSGSLYQTLHHAIDDSILPRPERDRLIAELADDVFGWEIDFSYDFYEGDEFRIVYERLTSSLGDVRYGRLVVAEVETRDSAHRAYLLADEQGRNAWFDERGVSLRRAFTRNPVAFLRISSRYTSRRRHPVLGTWRAHRGTDYAARHGTEIYATGDGMVRTAARNGGYGLMVAIRHPRGIETRYAHLSRLASGIAPGVRVRQKQVIGYVGASGLANGPHVHYEFLKNGTHQNPLRADLGDGSPLPDARRVEFADTRARYDRLLEGVSPERLAIRGDEGRETRDE